MNTLRSDLNSLAYWDSWRTGVIHCSLWYWLWVLCTTKTYVLRRGKDRLKDEKEIW